jgi:perosamine synthetase
MFKETAEFIRKIFKEEEGFIALHEPRFAGNEKKYLNDCIDSTFVSSVGKYVGRFEEMIRDYTGAKAAIACTNGTLGLHIALKMAGVRPGELVITQPLTFIATCNAISYLNAEPLFIDVDKKTLGLSPQKLEEFLNTDVFLNNSGECIHRNSGKRIGACVPMHTFGHPAEIDKILSVCRKYSIPVVEDAAESIGSTYKNTQTGRFGLFGVYSFNGNKTITCGGGGMIITDDEELGKLAKHMTTQAKVSHPWDFNHDMIGYNYRLPNINAALAVAQMECLDDFIKNKRELASIYHDFFKNSPWQFVSEPENSCSNYWLNAIFLKDRGERDQFLKFTNDNKIMTRPAWILMPKLPMFAKCICADISNAIWIEDRLVNIPSSARLK